MPCSILLVDEASCLSCKVPGSASKEALHLFPISRGSDVMQPVGPRLSGREDFQVSVSLK